MQADAPMDTIDFIHMADGTREEYELIERCSVSMDENVVDNVLGLLETLKGNTYGYKVDRYTHSLQSATLALRDGADEEQIVCALLHDVGDNFAPHNHSQLAAAILRPYVSDENHWVVAHHGLFQGYYYFHHFDKDRNARDEFKDHPHYEACVRFCERWDQCAFDPDYDTLPLEHFEPMVRRVFAEPRLRSV
jgi:predicted HD phosphohydrolase